MTPLLRVQARTAIQLVTPDGHRLQGGHAALVCLRETGWHPTLVRLLEHRPFVWLVELGYHFVAANRPRFTWFIPRSL
jgi:predicted DCC family thiol-disulfide oxidoreductase YuxK